MIELYVKGSEEDCFENFGKLLGNLKAQYIDL